MEWVLRSPQIHSTFSNLGFIHGDGYHINDNCNTALDAILNNILNEDKYLRTYRRNISFGQNVKKDLIPLLIHAKEDKTIELLVEILVNITIPVECLFSMEDISKTDFGRHTVFEINNLLTATKVAFTDIRVTKVVVEFLKKQIHLEQQLKLSSRKCTQINNGLLLLRNILHIPEEGGSVNSGINQNHNLSTHSIQNQILWNTFSQSIDKILIYLMNLPESRKWGVTMVQVLALLYKDQYVATLHNYIDLWLEATLSESSEDNESNTSPPVRECENSSPILTSDPTSDSSDTEGCGKSNDDPMSEENTWVMSGVNNISVQCFRSPVSNEEKKQQNQDMQISENTDLNDDTASTLCSNDLMRNCKKKRSSDKNDKNNMVISESSDCGYGTQIENQETNSTSSNETDMPKKKQNQKPRKPLHRTNNNKTKPTLDLHDRKRKKIVKRGKTNTPNVKGLSHKTPTDDDITNILKEFTVDFLLKGYNSMVQTIHSLILSNFHLEMDTSHFFWLITYFLKFASQIVLDIEHIGSILSFEVISYLTAEGVNMCEQFELAIKLDGKDLKPSLRRMHLVVTAIREFIQTVEAYNKLKTIRDEDKEIISKLQIKMCESEELRSLPVLLLRLYNQKYHNKQYLQDLIVTNHILLMFMDNVKKVPSDGGTDNFVDHIKQFAAPEIMHQYGLLLEDYATNGEFVNDCILTLMHHVGGELGSVISLFQPKILKIFTSIWKSEFEVCDDWSDLIEYVINTFVKKPHTLQMTANFRLDTESFDDDKIFLKPLPVTKVGRIGDQDVNMKSAADTKDSGNKEESWAEDELSSLNWIIMKCSLSLELVTDVLKMLADEGISKSRCAIIKEIFNQKLISKEEFDKLQTKENEKSSKKIQNCNEVRDDEIKRLCEQLIQDGKYKFLDWVQKSLLENCFIKIYIDKKLKDLSEIIDADVDIKNFVLFKKTEDLPVVSSAAYHAVLHGQSVPLVPWNCEQAAICKDLRFLQLLHKLGFHMPVDSGKLFIRIPQCWTVDVLYNVAGKVGPIDTSKLKFAVTEISDVNPINVSQAMEFVEEVSASCETLESEPSGSDVQSWLDVVQKAHEYKIVNLESICESASVASDLTRMFVSDEDEKQE